MQILANCTHFPSMKKTRRYLCFLTKIIWQLSHFSQLDQIWFVFPTLWYVQDSKPFLNFQMDKIVILLKRFTYFQVEQCQPSQDGYMYTNMECYCTTKLEGYSLLLQTGLKILSDRGVDTSIYIFYGFVVPVFSMEGDYYNIEISFVSFLILLPHWLVATESRETLNTTTKHYPILGIKWESAMY